MEWIVEASYTDGTTIERRFPYQEGGDYIREAARANGLKRQALEWNDKLTSVSVHIKPVE